MPKIDIKLAYGIVPVAPLNRHYLGMILNNQSYKDGMLPFGLRSASKIFSALADTSKWCCVYEGVKFI